MEPLRQNALRKGQRTFVDELPAEQRVQVALDLRQLAAVTQQTARLLEFPGLRCHAVFDALQQPGLAAELVCQ